MSAVTEVLSVCRAEARAALVGYLPVGYPDLPSSLKAFRTMVEAGVDIVEVGLPYSDPLMDGPVIQRATEAALAHGTHVVDGFAAVVRVRGRRCPGAGDVVLEPRPQPRGRPVRR